MVAAGDGELVVRGIELSFGVRGEEEVVEVGAQTGYHKWNAKFAGAGAPQEVPEVEVVVRHISFRGMGEIELLPVNTVLPV